MPKKKLHLTVDERLLLHLSCYSIMDDEIEAPYALTQQGIADAINVLRSAVPRSIRPALSCMKFAPASPHSRVVIADS